MKKKLFFLVLLAISISNILSAQDRLPVQRQLMYNDTTLETFTNGIGSFPISNKIMIGFHWGNEASISKAILANQNNVFAQYMYSGTPSVPDLRLFQDNCLLFVEGVDKANGDVAGVYSHVLGDTGVLNARYISFKPNMLISNDDTTQYQMLSKRPYDTTNPIFGFQYVHPLALANNKTLKGDADYSFLLIPNISLKDSVICSEPWGSEYLNRWKRTPEEIIINDSAQRKYHGYNICVSVNIKRLGADYEGLDAGNNVIEIKLPYTLHDPTITGYIKFDQIPTADTFSIVSSYGEYRGKKTGFQVAPYLTTSFYITKDMLPSDSSTITVSARFRCWGIENEDRFKNRLLSSPTTKRQEDIKKLGITVIYRGGCPAGLESIVLSSPHAKSLFEGAYDTKICNFVQDDIHQVNTYMAETDKGARIYRFTDVTEADVQFFGASRYIRYLLGDVWSGSNGPVLPVLYEHYVDPPDRFLQITKTPTSVNAPYIEKGIKEMGLQYKSLGYICGRTQSRAYADTLLTTEEQLNSGYETFYPYTIPPDTGVFYRYNDFQSPNLNVSRIYKLKWRSGSDSPFNSFQAFKQFGIWYTFYNDTISGFQYSDKPWYGQIHNLIEWRTKRYSVLPNTIDTAQLDKNNPIFNYNYKVGVPPAVDSVIFSATTFNSDVRPPTAEEARLDASILLAEGARGLMYDGFSYNTKLVKLEDIYTRLACDSALKHHPLIDNNYFDYLMQDELGGDYLDYTNEAIYANDLFFTPFKTLFLNFLKDDVDKNEYMKSVIGCDANHLYLGRKSVRCEYYKIHKYIRSIDTMLMQLKLKCSYGKGMFATYNQHPDSVPAVTGILMDKFISKSGIKTRKLWQPLVSGGYVKPTTYEPESERFFDVTILARNSYPMNRNYILSCVNRRTDPSVWVENNSQLQGSNWEIQFKPAAEFDELTNGTDPIAMYWKDMIFKRFGCREISIPMKNPTDYDDTDVSFRITELGYDNDSLKKEFWFQEPYNHIIDTNLLVGDTLRLRMLPGALKMLNVEVLTPMIPSYGHLDYPNQTKLVAFPCDSNFNADGVRNFGKVRYHMVYTGPYNNKNAVYYKRSKPMNPSEPNICWEGETHFLNHTLTVKNCNNIYAIAHNLSSNFPSLVVRCDTINNELVPMVYVVYQADGDSCEGLGKLRIIENVFPANDSNQIIPWGSQIAEFASGKSYYDSTEKSIWGIPVINASAHGNYYAWNDSLLGIVAGFKLPNERGMIPPTQLTSFYGIPTIGGNIPHTYHPSMNTYSTISDDERDCAIVWEENSMGQYRSPINQIFYTRLKYCPNSGITHYVTQNWADTNEWYQRAIYVDNRRIVRIDDPNQNFIYEHMPMIYRDVDYYDANLVTEYNGMWGRILKQDRVYYQSRISYDDNKQGIFMKFITIQDNLDTNDCIPYSPSNWLIEGTPIILSASKDLANPNDVQGKLVKKYHQSGNILYYSFAPADNDSVAVLNFVEYPHTFNPTADVPRSADIWQINHGYFSLFYGPFSYDYSLQFPYNIPKAHKIGSQGRSSQLARLPYINNDKTWEYGRRIIESSIPDQGEFSFIESYQYLFSKKTFEKDENFMFYGFEDTLGNRSVFTPIYLTIDEREQVILPKLDKEHKIYNDTLYSDWFEIGNIQDIDMLQFGSNKKCLDLKVQRKDDKKLFSIKTDKLNDKMDYTKHNVHLLNGKSKQYRFAWIKTTKSNFTEMTILGLPAMDEITKDELIGKTSINMDEGYLDLSSDVTSEIPEGSVMHIYPNPANEKVLVFFEQDVKSDVNIAIYDLLGNLLRTVHSGTLEKGSYQYGVNTKGFTSGVYVVKADKRTQTIIKKLIIE